MSYDKKRVLRAANFASRPILVHRACSKLVSDFFEVDQKGTTLRSAQLKFS